MAINVINREMHLENLDLNLIVAIDALMRHRSVTDAAAEMCISQSALSSALKRARAHFGDEILFYNGQNMVPTAFGSALEAEVRELIVPLRMLSRRRAQEDISLLNRRFTIIASDYVAAVYVSELCRHLARVAPDVSISVVPFTEDAMQRFHRGAIDFLIGPTFAMEESFEPHDLFRDTFACVLSRDNPLAHRMTEEDFFAAPQVVTEFFLDDGRSHFERWLVERNRPVKIVASLPSFVVLPHYIAGTENVATIHNRLVPHFAGNPDLVFVKPPVPIPPLIEHLVSNRRNRHDTDAMRLRDIMLEVGRGLVTQTSM